MTLNQWHWVKISRTGLEGVLEIDDNVAAIGQSQGVFTQLTLTDSDIEPMALGEDISYWSRG